MNEEVLGAGISLKTTMNTRSEGRVQLLGAIDSERNQAESVSQNTPTTIVFRKRLSNHFNKRN
jgi:hypothetical protein